MLAVMHQDVIAVEECRATLAAMIFVAERAHRRCLLKAAVIAAEERRMAPVVRSLRRPTAEARRVRQVKAGPTSAPLVRGRANLAVRLPHRAVTKSPRVAHPKAEAALTARARLELPKRSRVGISLALAASPSRPRIAVASVVNPLVVARGVVVLTRSVQQGVLVAPSLARDLPQGVRPMARPSISAVRALRRVRPTAKKAALRKAGGRRAEAAVGKGGVKLRKVVGVAMMRVRPRAAHRALEIVPLLVAVARAVRAQAGVALHLVAAARADKVSSH